MAGAADRAVAGPPCDHCILPDIPLRLLGDDRVATSLVALARKQSVVIGGRSRAHADRTATPSTTIGKNDALVVARHDQRSVLRWPAPSASFDGRGTVGPSTCSVGTSAQRSLPDHATAQHAAHPPP